MTSNIQNTLISPLVVRGREGNLNLYGKKSQDINVHTCKQYLYHPINSQAPTSLNTAARVIDTFPRNKKGLLRELFLEFSITNNSASSLGMNPFVFLIDYIDFKIGSKVIAKWKGEDLFSVNNLVKTDYEIALEQAVTNIAEATYGAYAATLTAGSSAFVRIDLSPIVSSENGLLVDGFTEDFTIEINTRQTNKWCTAATASTASLSTTSWAIQYGFELLGDEDYDIRYNAHRANAFEYKYAEPINQIQPHPSVSSNIEYNFTLKPYIANVHAMFFTLRPQGAINESLFTYYPLALMYLQDNDSRIIGDYKTTGQWIQQNSGKDFPLNFYLSRMSLYPQVFSRAILDVIDSGISVGSLYFTGQSESYYFSASGSLSNVNTEMVVTGLVESTLKCVQGMSNVTRESVYNS